VEYLRHLDPLIAPVVALVGLLATLVAIINWQGKKLGKHDELLSLLDVRVANIHKDREATRVRKPLDWGRRRLEDGRDDEPEPQRHRAISAW
jgi:hypothetical protein